MVKLNVATRCPGTSLPRVNEEPWLRNSENCTSALNVTSELIVLKPSLAPAIVGSVP